MNKKKHIKNKKIKKSLQWLLNHAMIVFSCAAIIAFGIVFLAHSSPGTTTIGENISTNNLTAYGNLEVGGNATTTGNMVVTGNTTILTGIGIRTTTPIYSLDVNGDLRIQGKRFKETYVSPDTGCHQGYTTDGTYHYIIHTNIIYRKDSGWNNVVSNSNPFPNANYDHLADGDYYNGKLYIPMEQWASCENFSYQSIAVFNASDLSRESVNDISAQGHEVGGLVVVPEDGDNGVIYVISYCDGSKIWKYDLNDFSYLGYIGLTKTLGALQGITYKNGFFYVMADYIWRIAKDGTVLNSVYAPPSIREGLDYSQNELRFLVDAGVGEAKIHYLEFDDTGPTLFANSLPGRVGIGTSNPSELLHIENTAGNAALRVNSKDASNASLQLYEDTGYGFEFQYYGIGDRLDLWSRKFGGNEAIRMSWFKDGRVGIGELNPRAMLDIKKTVAPQTAEDLLILNSSNSGVNSGSNILFRNNLIENMVRIGSNDDGNWGSNLVFETNPTGGGGSDAPLERMRITSTGKIGIGTTTPSSLLDIFSTTTTILEIDSSSDTKGACLKMKDSDGSGYTYCTFNDGLMNCTTTSCE